LGRLFFGFFTVKSFFRVFLSAINRPQAGWPKAYIFVVFLPGFILCSKPGKKIKEPAIDIAGLCLPLKPQKEKVRNIFHCSLF
jgi:hypothetical protein